MSYTPLYEMWRSTVDDVPFDVVLDLGHFEDYPRRDLPWFFGVRIPMADKLESGLPPDTEATRLDVVENRIRDSLRQREAMYVGRRTGGANRDLMFYLDSRPRGIQDRIRASIGMEMLFISRADPEWQGYEQLLPSPQELRQIEDRRVVDELLDQGATAAAIHELYHRVQTSSPKGAEALRKLFMKLELLDVTIQGERPEIIVVGRQETALDVEAINRVAYILEDKAPKARGEYLGWRADPVQLAQPEGVIDEGDDGDDDDLDFLLR